MPSEQINFRYEVSAGTSLRLAHRSRKPGRLTGGFMHFPPGCNAVVQVRVLISSPSLGGIRQVTPIQDQYVALDDANWEFTLDEEILKDDQILVDMRNTGAQDHQITVIVTRWSEEPTQIKMKKEEQQARLKRFEKERRTDK